MQTAVSILVRLWYEWSDNDGLSWHDCMLAGQVTVYAQAGYYYNATVPIGVGTVCTQAPTHQLTVHDSIRSKLDWSVEMSFAYVYQEGEMSPLHEL